MIATLAFALLQQALVLPARATDSVWYRAIDTRDLTGDGVADTLILQATGRRVDSLRVTFDIRAQGRRLYHESWLSTWYFQYDMPIDSIADATKRKEVFNHFQEFFRAAQYAPLDTAGAGGPWNPAEDQRDQRSTIAFNLKYERALDSLKPSHLPQDSAESIARHYARTAPVDSGRILRAWQDLAHGHRVTFTFFSGGEYIRTIVWSRTLGRFVVVFACC
jgi:hypothetical protein